MTAESLTPAHDQGYRLAQYASVVTASQDAASGYDDGAGDNSDRDRSQPPRSSALALEPYVPPHPSAWAGQASAASP